MVRPGSAREGGQGAREAFLGLAEQLGVRGLLEKRAGTCQETEERVDTHLRTNDKAGISPETVESAETYNENDYRARRQHKTIERDVAYQG